MLRRIPGRDPVPGGLSAVAAGLVLLAALGCGADDPAPAGGPDAAPRASAEPTLPCHEKGYPCSWVDVDAEVALRGREVGDRAAARLERSSAASVRDWLLEEVDEVAEAEVVDRDVRFRLEGGRPMWILAEERFPREDGEAASRRSTPLDRPDAFRKASLLHAATALPAALARTTSAATSALAAPDLSELIHVAGRDRNGDGLLDQRDGRKALVLDPFRWEYEERLGEWGDELARDLAEEADYDVTHLPDRRASVQAFGTWRDYDVVHLITHGNKRMWATSVPVDWDRWEERGRAARPEMRKVGLDLGRLGGTWYYVIPPAFLAWTYRGGLEGTVVIVSGCKSAGPEDGPVSPMVRPLLGERTMVTGWDGRVLEDDAKRTSIELNWLLVQGFSGEAAYEELEDDGHHISQPGPPGEAPEPDEEIAHLRLYGDDLRILERVKLFHPNPLALLPRIEVRSHHELADMIHGHFDDGAPDSLTVEAEVGTIYGDETPDALVWLELDGRGVGDTLSLAEAEQGRGPPPHWDLTFERVPLEEDLQPERPYELAAVAALPEGNETRFGVDLTGTRCPDVQLGDFEGRIGGVGAQTIERGEKLRDAQVLVDALGRWDLVLDDTGQGDFRFHVVLPSRPRAEEQVRVDSPVCSPGEVAQAFASATTAGDVLGAAGGMSCGKIGGLVGERDGSFAYKMLGGQAAVRYTGANEEMVCGTLEADVKAVRSDAKGMNPPTVPVTISVRFWAELRPGDGGAAVDPGMYDRERLMEDLPEEVREMIPER